ncbi:MAG: hypothetical protein E7233_05830 [Lachnospiraceae bacterium]|nr:hypothetical protein [Lachnospiraceae bacterium]
MKLKANLFRTESRGMHYREDYPFHNDAEWLCHVGVYKADDGQVACMKYSLFLYWWRFIISETPCVFGEII